MVMVEVRKPFKVKLNDGRIISFSPGQKVKIMLAKKLKELEERRLVSVLWYYS